jgi:purine nucleoside phosphorylase
MSASPLGIIGGTSLLNSSYFANLEKKVISTEHGDVNLHFGNGFIFCQRHHADPAKEYTPPHLINFRAIIAGFKLSGVEVRFPPLSGGALVRIIMLI